MDIESDIKEKTAVVKLQDRTENVETDYRYARENLYNLVERGQDAIDGILELSKETEHQSMKLQVNLLKQWVRQQKNS